MAKEYAHSVLGSNIAHLLGREAFSLSKLIYYIRYIGRLVALAAHGGGCHIGRVCLKNYALYGYILHDLKQMGVLKCEHSADAETKVGAEAQ